MVRKESSNVDQINLKANDNEPRKSNFVGDTQDELIKVVWPSRQQLLSESAAVILMVSLVATVIYLVDNLFSWGAGRIF